jgi:hypothetical protein
VSSIPSCGGPPREEFILDCNTGAGYTVTGFDDPTPAAPSLRILSIYGSPTGTAVVNVTRPERLILVLSAYESTHWTVTVAPDALLERVILNGAEEQTATVPAGVPVENRSPWALSFCPDAECNGYRYPDNGDGDTDLLISAAEQATGLCLTSFHGCYDASQFAVPLVP